VAQADLALRGIHLPDRGMDRTRGRSRASAGAADHAGVLVGDRSAASRARLGGRSGPAAGHDLADRVESIQPLLEALAEDETRSTDVTTLGVEGARVAPRVHQACGYRRPRPECDARLGVTFHLEWNGCPTLSQGWVLTPLCNRYVKQTHDRGTAKKLLRRIIPIRERSARKTSSQTGSTRLGWTWRTR
jgi:hypothetical protein